MTLITRRTPAQRRRPPRRPCRSLGGRAFARTPLKVGFIYLGPVGDYGWTYAHDQGRRGGRRSSATRSRRPIVENVAEGPDSERVIRDLAQEGNKLIFTTLVRLHEPDDQGAPSDSRT